MALIDALHGFRIGLRALAVIESVGIREENSKCLDVISFACSCRIERARLGKQLTTELEIVLGWPFPQLVIQTHGLTPIGHGAAWVFLFDFLKLFAGLFVFKRMQKSYAALKLRMRGLNTGSGERHGAELLADIVAVCLVLSEARRRECKDKNNKNGAAVSHRGLHSCESLFV